MVALRTGALPAFAEARLRADCRVVPLESHEAAAARVLVTGGGSGADAALIGRLPALELIAVNAVGHDRVDLAAAAARGIRVTNTPDVLTDDVADLAIGLMIAAARRLVPADRFVRDGRWAAGEAFPLTTRLAGRRLGILGLGRIGRAIAARATPMRLDIAYHGRHRVPDVPWPRLESPLALAAWADILVVSAPATPATAGIVDADVLAALGPHGLLVNVARGSLVDEAALVAALTTGRLGAAGLDVYADEPRVPAALIGSDRTVLLPHVGSATEETRAAMAELVLANVAAHLAGRPLLTPVAMPAAR